MMEMPYQVKFWRLECIAPKYVTSSKDYFELKAIEKPKMQEELFSFCLSTFLPKSKAVFPL